jgi:hypothetical protein
MPLQSINVVQYWKENKSANLVSGFVLGNYKWKLRKKPEGLAIKIVVHFVKCKTLPVGARDTGRPARIDRKHHARAIPIRLESLKAATRPAGRPGRPRRRALLGPLP